MKGAVAYAFVVLKAPGAGREEAKAIAASVNGGLPFYQRLAYVEAVPTIARSANGKIQRKDFRTAALRAGSTGAALSVTPPVTE